MMRGLLSILLASSLVFMASLPARAQDQVEIEFWKSVKNSNSAEELETYLEIYPKGKFAPLAKIRLKKLKSTLPGATDKANSSAAPRPSENVKYNNKAGGKKPREKSVTVKLGSMPDGSNRPWLGVSISNLPDWLAKAASYDVSKCAVVRLLNENGPAAKAGLFPGLCLIAIDGVPTPKASDLVEVIGRQRPGQEVQIKIVELFDTPEEYLETVRVAANKRNTDAMHFLGNAYKRGTDGVKEDKAEAVRWYHKAAALGHAQSMSLLALIYERGDGVSKDHAEALKWYRKAAELGDAEAMERLRDLGVSHSTGSPARESKSGSENSPGVSARDLQKLD